MKALCKYRKMVPPKVTPITGAALMLLLLSVCCISTVAGFQHLINEFQSVEQFEFECYSAAEKVNLTPRFASSNQNDSISLQVSRRFTHQIVSRIYAIFLREVLGYRNVKLVEYRDKLPTQETERIRMFITMEHLVSHGGAWPDPTIDLEVWLLSDYHYIPSEIQEGGAIMNPGRFGLFIPKPLIRKEDAFPKPLIYTLFKEDVNDRRYYDFIKKFDIPNPVLASIYRYAERKCGEECDEYGIHIPPQCTEGRKCALVLAPHYEDTRFLVKHILEMEFQLKVMWLGDKLKLGIRQLMDTYAGERKNVKKFLVFHWTPSEVINTKTMEYAPVIMPRCEDMIASNDTGCKYEMTPLLKYYANQLRQADYALNSLQTLHFKEEHIQYAFDLYDKYEDQILQARQEAKSDYDQLGVTRYYDQIACEWMRDQEPVWSGWKPIAKPEDVYIGGIFPLSGMGPSYLGIAPAALLAAQDINMNRTILSNYKLTVQQNDGQCRADTVMKSFIGYYIQQTRVIGILGPACSETVEPIAGVSKHFRMAVISYSAEGAFLSDRETYPYFFRTIGENRQYEHVYAQLLPRLNWHRVAALTEDGQKATEYISYMETLLKDNSIELISNKKFPRDSNDIEMKRYLLDLKSKNAKIIIADVDDKVARVIMCEAYKLEMTAENGYIWFLPVWLSNVWNLSSETQGTGSDQRSPPSDGTGSSSSCSNSELLRAMNGHFSLSHAPYADDDTRLDVDGTTVRMWKQKYAQNLKDQGYMASDYAGYAYDAVWVYALAFERLLREDPSYFSNLHSEHTTNRLMELIRETDFQGVSGRIRFNEAGSRYTTIHVLQFVNGTANKVGYFSPNISESNYQLIGGSLVLNESAIIWMTHDGRTPDDGALVCTFDSFARVFGVNCEEVTMIVISMASVISILFLSVASFLFWKVRYDRKMKTSAKYLQKLGIDLLSPTSIPYNTLDKWEIPKDRVVINRRLGEGAFGTVYGGEAQIADEGWTAVAVKTLKVGSTTEDKVDFLSEAEAMKRFDHNNIVRLLGVCLQSEPVYTIMEFMLYGDLKTYLLARRHLVNSKQSEDSDISNKRLTMMALDVSRALSYLAEQKYVHRDVACRNCMVNAQRVVKLGDFGMARPTFENDYYRFNRKGMLPVRWMAPEALALGFFTPASDVWSYGVLLYEIITFGSFPFQGLTNNQVLEHLKNSNTLSIPNGVKPQLEGLMKACWNQDYKKRPSASEVSEFISNYPRLLNPCLDVPLASVEMVDSDSGHFEMLPDLRKFKDDAQPTADLLVGTQPMNDLNNGYNNVSIMSTGGAQRNNRQRAINLNDLNVATDFITVYPPVPVDDYHEDAQSSRQPLGPPNSANHLNDPDQPLLQRDTEATKSNNSLLRYVPMFGFSKNKTITIGGTIISTGNAKPVTSSLQCATSLGAMGSGTGAAGGNSSPQSPTGSVLGMSGGTMIVNTRSTSTTIL